MKTVYTINHRFIVAFCMLFAMMLINFSVFSQEYIMTDGGNITTCSGTFYDPGGQGNYPPPPQGFVVGIGGESIYTYTICNSVPDQPITVTFTSFQLWGNFKTGWPPCLVTSQDKLYIYNGSSTSAQQIGVYERKQSPGTVVGATGCLTFKLELDNTGSGSPCAESTGAPGWVATISTPPISAGPIEGPDTLFTSTTGTYTSEGTPGINGTWESSDPAGLFINTQGVATALAVGDYTIKYTVTDCGGDIAIKVVKVRDEPKEEEPPAEDPPKGKVGIVDDLPITANAITDLFLYPNPTNNIVNVEFSLSNSDEMNIQLVDMAGRILAHQTFQGSQGTNNVPLNVSEYTNGVYSVIVHSNNSKLVKRLIKD